MRKSESGILAKMTRFLFAEARFTQLEFYKKDGMELLTKARKSTHFPLNFLSL